MTKLLTKLTKLLTKLTKLSKLLTKLTNHSRTSSILTKSMKWLTKLRRLLTKLMIDGAFANSKDKLTSPQNWERSEQETKGEHMMSGNFAKFHYSFIQGGQKCNLHDHCSVLEPYRTSSLRFGQI